MKINIQKINKNKSYRLIIIIIVIIFSIMFFYVTKNLQTSHAGSASGLLASYSDATAKNSNTLSATINGCIQAKTDPAIGNYYDVTLSLTNPTSMPYFSYATYNRVDSQNSSKDYKINYLDSNGTPSIHYYSPEVIHQSFIAKGSSIYSFVVSADHHDEFYATFSNSPITQFGILSFLGSDTTKVSIQDQQSFQDGLYDPSTLPTCTQDIITQANTSGKSYDGLANQNYSFNNSEAISDNSIVLINNPFMLIMSSDGSLKLQNDGINIWTSHTSYAPGAYAVLQSDGNFCIFTKDGTKIWETNTANNPGDYLNISSSGILSVMSSPDVSSKNPGNSNILWSIPIEKKL